MSPYSWMDHTGELELAVEAGSAEAVFAEAAAALGELFGRAEGEPATELVELRDGDRSSLLVDFLQELVYLSETRGFVPEGADVTLDESRLSATVRGHRGETRPLVKAATYHGLSFTEEDGVWRARVVLDV